jgi:aminoglycoside phosphotransferase (APT) family kinase protein
MHTPAGLIAASVRRATGERPASSRRVIDGEINEVYEITTGGGREIIVRIGHDEDPRFEAERWALDAVRARGVPTPEVLLVETVDLGGGAGGAGGTTVAVCVEQRLPGVPLDRLLRSDPLGRLGIDVAQIGEILAAIHGVEVDGFGYLRPDGRGWPISFASIMLDLLDKTAELARAAGTWGVPIASVEAGLDLLNRNQSRYGHAAARLVHGDFTARHLLIGDGRITGVLDLQNCSGNHPVQDFVWWYDTGQDLAHPVPVASLVEAYPDRARLGPDFAALFNLVLLRHCLWMLMVYAEQGNPYRIEALKRALARALRFEAL